MGPVPIREAIAIAFSPLDDQHLGSALEFHLVDVAQEFPAHQQHLHLGMIEDVGHLGRSQAPVHRHRHGPRLGGAKEQFEIFGHVLVQEGHPVAGLHPRGQQGLGDAVGGGVELGVTDATLAIHQSRLVTLAFRKGAGNVGDGAEAFTLGHGITSWDGGTVG